MIVLAVDSTATCATAAACLFENNKLVTYALTTSKNGLTHSETLLPIADGVLRLLGKRMDEVGLFAVSAGPGSFTGVRIGVSLVKGLSFANGTPCAAVSPLEALAKAHEAFPGVVCAVMDARRGQYYNALFQNGERLCSDRTVDTDTLLAELGDESVLVCGDGAAVLCEQAQRENLHLAPESSREQNALSVALCGYRHWLLGYAVTPDALSPVYLRKPQAEREREERLNKGDTAK